MRCEHVLQLPATVGLRAAAAQGDATAQTQLAIIYHRGRPGVRPDYELALECYQMAADQGKAEAMLKRERLRQQQHLAPLPCLGCGAARGLAGRLGCLAYPPISRNSFGKKAFRNSLLFRKFLRK